MVLHRCLLLALATISPLASAFAPPTNRAPTLPSIRIGSCSSLYSAAPSDTSIDNDVPASFGSAAERVEECKRSLVSSCDSHELGSGYDGSIESKITELEQFGEDAGKLFYSKGSIDLLTRIYDLDFG